MTLRQPSTDATSPIVPARLVKQPSAFPLILAAAGLLVGTGGTVNSEMLRICAPTGGMILLRIPTIIAHRGDPDSVLLPHEQMAAIRRYLSMNISEMAKVLRVERPTVYSWLKGEVDPRSTNLERINAIYSIAREWRSMSSTPVGVMLNTHYGDSTTLLDLLSEEDIAKESVHHALATLRTAIERVPDRISVADIAKARGVRLRARDISKVSQDEQFNM